MGRVVSPASREEPRSALVRFPLRAGGTLRRGFSFIRAFTNFGCAIVITTETHTTNSTPHPHPSTTPHRDFSTLHPHIPHDPRTRHLFPHPTPHTARATTHPEKSTAHAPDTRPNAHHPSTRPTHNTRSIATPRTPTHSTPHSAPRRPTPSTASPQAQTRSSTMRPIPPDNTNLQPSPTRALHAPAPQAAPVASPCAAATCLAASTRGG